MHMCVHTHSCLWGAEVSGLFVTGVEESFKSPNIDAGTKLGSSVRIVCALKPLDLLPSSRQVLNVAEYESS